MNAQSPSSKTRGSLVAGAILVLIGLLSLAGQLIQADWFGRLIPLALGLIFVVWGILTRSGGLLIPGGILTGIGTGAFLIEGPFSALTGEAEGGVFLLAFAGGWVLITLLSALFTTSTMWWALIPGGILGLIGLALISGEPGLQALSLLGYAWPIILIAIGLYLVFWRKSLQE